MTIAPHTICILVHLRANENYVGRLVTAMGRWPDDDEWYVVDAPWLREAYRDAPVLAERRCLLPIAPPAEIGRLAAPSDFTSPSPLSSLRVKH